MKHFLAIDPGGVHQGVAYFCTTPRGLIRYWTRDLTRKHLIQVAEECQGIDGWVVEEFRLYPELAREQGYSDFPTVEVIGVLQYLADKRNLTMVRQGASTKSKSRQLGQRVAPHLGGERRIGTATGRAKYGWDFSAPSQHERDATAHGVWYAFRGGASELFEKDYKKNGGLGLLWD